MKVFTQAEFDALPIERGYKYGTAGDYPIGEQEMIWKKIEMGKQYRYRNGAKATILTTSRPNSELTVVSMSEFGIITVHYPDGKAPMLRSDDLVEIVPFEDFKKDEPVLVRHLDESSWARRHFSHAKDGMAWCYVDGKTSWSSVGHSIPFAQCRRPTPEEMGLKDES